MSDLTPQELCVVAREVTGLDYIIDGEYIAISGTVTAPNTWQPTFEHESYWQRSQALAVCEWIFANSSIDGGIHSCGLVDRIYEAMNSKDINALMKIVLELRGKAG